MPSPAGVVDGTMPFKAISKKAALTLKALSLWDFSVNCFTIKSSLESSQERTREGRDGLFQKQRKKTWGRDVLSSLLLPLNWQKSWLKCHWGHWFLKSTGTVSIIGAGGRFQIFLQIWEFFQFCKKICLVCSWIQFPDKYTELRTRYINYTGVNKLKQTRQHQDAGWWEGDLDIEDTSILNASHSLWRTNFSI